MKSHKWPLIFLMVLSVLPQIIIENQSDESKSELTIRILLVSEKYIEAQ
jgi:hypothetical protein